MEAKLALAREWAVKVQELQYLLHTKIEEVRGLWDFDAHQLKMLEEERSPLSAIVEDWVALLSAAMIDEEVTLVDLGAT